MHYFFQETISLQNIERASENAAFFSEEVQFFFQKNSTPSLQSYSIVFKTLD